MPLIQDGVAHRVVHSASTGATTGHATRPGDPRPRPEHLVLVGGGAAGIVEPAAGMDHGLLITDLHGWRARGVRVIAGGQIGPGARDLRVDVDPIAVLAATDALTARQRLVPQRATSARTIGATVCPALRARGGVTVRP